MKKLTYTSFFVPVFAGLLLFPGFARGEGGSLNPPGPPSPTMTTLDELRQTLESVESALDEIDPEPPESDPRTPISELPYTISESGSYYLTGDLQGGADGGITISSGDVTLDLMGFALIGGEGRGIDIPWQRMGITIRNGTIRDWSDNGIGGNARHSQFESLRVRNNGGTGIRAHEGGLIRNCTVSFNDGHGISTYRGIVKDSIAIENGRHGISATVGSTVQNCVAEGNGEDGIWASNGTVIGSVASNNVEAGIRVQRGAVSNSVARSNGEEGIWANHGVAAFSVSHNNEGTNIADTGAILTGNKDD